MATKAKIVDSNTKYIVTYDDDVVHSYYDTVSVLFLDHPPDADLIERYASEYGVDIDDIIVYELGRKGKVERVVSVVF